MSSASGCDVMTARTSLSAVQIVWLDSTRVLPIWRMRTHRETRFQYGFAVKETSHAAVLLNLQSVYCVSRFRAIWFILLFAQALLSVQYYPEQCSRNYSDTLESHLYLGV